MSERRFNTEELSEEEVTKYQRKITHYLQEYRNDNDLTQKEMASKLNYKEDSYRKLEGPKGDNRIISSINYLKSFAHLRNMTLSEFVTYITSSEYEPPSNERQHYSWEDKLLKAFGNSNMETRSLFIHKICKEVNNNQSLQENFNYTVDISSKIFYLNEKQKKVIEMIISFI